MHRVGPPVQVLQNMFGIIAGRAVHCVGSPVPVLHGEICLVLCQCRSCRGKYVWYYVSAGFAQGNMFGIMSVQVLCSLVGPRVQVLHGEYVCYYGSARFLLTCRAASAGPARWNMFGIMLVQVLCSLVGPR